MLIDCLKEAIHFFLCPWNPRVKRNGFFKFAEAPACCFGQGARRCVSIQFLLRRIGEEEKAQSAWGLEAHRREQVTETPYVPGRLKHFFPQSLFRPEKQVH